MPKYLIMTTGYKCFAKLLSSPILLKIGSNFVEYCMYYINCCTNVYAFKYQTHVSNMAICGQNS